MKVEQYENATPYCEDCREVFDALPTGQAVITNPPYGIRYETRRRKFMERPRVIENDIAAPLWCAPLIAGKVEDGGKSNLPICGGTCDADYYDCMGEENT